MHCSNIVSSMSGKPWFNNKDKIGVGGWNCDNYFKGFVANVTFDSGHLDTRGHDFFRSERKWKNQLWRSFSVILEDFQKAYVEIQEYLQVKEMDHHNRWRRRQYNEKVSYMVDPASRTYLCAVLVSVDHLIVFSYSIGWLKKSYGQYSRTWVELLKMEKKNRL